MNVFSEQNRNVLNQQDDFNVVIIDDFSNKNVDIDGDGKGDLSHGDAVNEIISDNMTNADIEKIDISSSEKDVDPNKLLNTLNNLLERVNNGEDIDAINLSVGKMWYLEKVKELFPDLDQNNLQENSDELIEIFRNSGLEYYENTADVIETINKLDEKGVNVYLAGGNATNSETGSDGIAGSSCFNLFSLAEGATTVGANDNFGNIADWSASNNLIDKYTQGEFYINPEYENGDIVGFDISNRPTQYSLAGTSFATPFALSQKERLMA